MAVFTENQLVHCYSRKIWFRVSLEVSMNNSDLHFRATSNLGYGQGPNTTVPISLNIVITILKKSAVNQHENRINLSWANILSTDALSTARI